jgi:hypothetical protein
LRRVDRLELAIDLDLFQLVDQDQRGIAPRRNIEFAQPMAAHARNEAL